MKLSSRSVLIEALKTVIDVSKCGSANQMADVCQKIGGATRRTVCVNRYFMNHQLWCRWLQTVRMEQCHAPELPCNYIDPLLKSACLQVNTVHCSGEQDKQFYFQPHAVFHSMNGQEKPTTKYVFTFYRQFKRKMRNFQCKHLGGFCMRMLLYFLLFFRSTTLSAYLRTHMRWGSSNLKYWHCLSYEALKRIFQDGLHIDSFKLPVACSCRISNTRWKIWSK